jgi:NAD(P)-dependent dehydrogenase (short-subunit alcohol dehydrogenase family)
MILPSLRLDGRTALVTGASSGLGAHFARLAAAAGARVVLAARRIDRVEALAKEIGADALAVAMDVADEASVCAAYDAAEARFGVVDTIIANAGVSAPSRSTEISVERLRSVIDTNLLGLFLTAREGAKRLIAAGSRETGKGRILLVGSMGAQVHLPGEAMYCATKAAVAKLGRDLAREWVRAGVNVNTIQPGFIMSEMTESWFASEGGKAQMAGFPRRRLQPIESLDATVLHFLSDGSAAMTGSVITIDDGQSL